VNDDRPVSISALQHYAYCPRQFALIHVEQVWDENRFTAEGRVLHERVDSGASEQRRDLRTERSVMLRSESLKLVGKMDLLEIVAEQGEVYRPVEYKRGKPKTQDWDRIQLCAQALCLEEMRGVNVDTGAIWYWEVRHREQVKFDPELRDTTLSVIRGAHEILASNVTPAPISDKKKCKACSLVNLCEPQSFRIDKSASYVRELFES